MRVPKNINFHTLLYSKMYSGDGGQHPPSPLPLLCARVLLCLCRLSAVASLSPPPQKALLCIGAAPMLLPSCLPPTGSPCRRPPDWRSFLSILWFTFRSVSSLCRRELFSFASTPTSSRAFSRCTCCCSNLRCTARISRIFAERLSSHFSRAFRSSPSCDNTDCSSFSNLTRSPCSLSRARYRDTIGTAGQSLIKGKINMRLSPQTLTCRLFETSIFF